MPKQQNEATVSKLLIVVCAPLAKILDGVASQFAAQYHAHAKHLSRIIGHSGSGTSSVLYENVQM
eukprot:SAG31_NODE_28370_length_411_cov_0.778846_1_plen_65_part_00